MARHQREVATEPHRIVIPLSCAQALGFDGYLRCSYSVCMFGLRFEGDPVKAAQNTRKLGVSFEEAETVFTDEFASLLDDPDHSSEEDRFLLLGLSVKLRTLVVAHCYRKADDVIRIISARRATRKERDIYYQRWRR